MNYTRGFTLIELLVVMAIIGVLSSIILSSLNSARVKARDAGRATAIHQVHLAVESYYLTNGHYPNTNNVWTSFDSPNYSPNPIYTPDAANLSTALLPYIKSPADPKSLGTDSGYLYISPTGADYCILFWRTPENLNNFGSTLVNYARCTGGVNSNGQCVGSSNSIYVGTGPYAPGC